MLLYKQELQKLMEALLFLRLLVSRWLKMAVTT